MSSDESVRPTDQTASATKARADGWINRIYSSADDTWIGLFKASLWIVFFDLIAWIIAAILNIPPHSGSGRNFLMFPALAAVLALFFLFFMAIVSLIAGNEYKPEDVILLIVIILINITVIVAALKITAVPLLLWPMKSESTDGPERLHLVHNRSR